MVNSGMNPGLLGILTVAVGFLAAVLCDDPVTHALQLFSYCAVYIAIDIVFGKSSVDLDNEVAKEKEDNENLRELLRAYEADHKLLRSYVYETSDLAIALQSEQHKTRVERDNTVAQLLKEIAALKKEIATLLKEIAALKKERADYHDRAREVDLWIATHS